MPSSSSYSPDSLTVNINPASLSGVTGETISPFSLDISNYDIMNDVGVAHPFIYIHFGDCGPIPDDDIT